MLDGCGENASTLPRDQRPTGQDDLRHDDGKDTKRQNLVMGANEVRSMSCRISGSK